ncbi:MAG: hypothetical protein U0324_30170 [Polyangiales bacterium]
MTPPASSRASAPPAEPGRARYTAIAAQQSGAVQFISRAVAPPPGGAPWRVALGYRRFREFDQGNYAGQDWCALGVEQGRCVGVVTDGVSQSFMGDIAAQRAGAALWGRLLAHRQPLTVDEVRGWFDDFSKAIHPEVEGYALAPNLPEMLKTSLEGKRQQHGSQTVLAAFTLDLEARTGQVLLIGDVHVVVHHEGGRREPIVADPRARWSSLKGLRGEPRLVPLTDVAGILLFSDGLEASFGDDMGRAFDQQGFLRTAEASAERDDVSLIAVSCAGFAELPDVDNTLHAHPPEESRESAEQTTRMAALSPPPSPLAGPPPRVQGLTPVPVTVLAPPPQPLAVDASQGRRPSYLPPAPARDDVPSAPAHRAQPTLPRAPLPAPPVRRKRTRILWALAIAAVAVGGGVMWDRLQGGDDPTQPPVTLPPPARDGGSPLPPPHLPPNPPRINTPQVPLTNVPSSVPRTPEIQIGPVRLTGSHSGLGAKVDVAGGARTRSRTHPPPPPEDGGALPGSGRSSTEHDEDEVTPSTPSTTHAPGGPGGARQSPTPTHNAPPSGAPTAPAAAPTQAPRATGAATAAPSSQLQPSPTPSQAGSAPTAEQGRRDE